MFTIYENTLIDAHDSTTPLDKSNKNVDVETSVSKTDDEEVDDSESHDKSSMRQNHKESHVIAMMRWRLLL